MEDSEIIKLYLQRDQKAITETTKKYSDYCHKLADRILRQQELADDAVGATWYQAWRTIPPQNPEVLSSYLIRITRKLCLEQEARRPAADHAKEVDVIRMELDDLCTGKGAQPKDLSRAAQDISEILKKEPLKHRIIFMRRYFFMESVKTIAIRLELNDREVRYALDKIRAAMHASLNITELNRDSMMDAVGQMDDHLIAEAEKTLNVKNGRETFTFRQIFSMIFTLVVVGAFIYLMIYLHRRGIDLISFG